MNFFDSLNHKMVFIRDAHYSEISFNECSFNKVCLHFIVIKHLSHLRFFCL